MRKRRDQRPSGFTLVEVIITLTLVAITASMLFTLFSSSGFTKSHEPIQGLQNASDLHTVMENICYDYEKVVDPPDVTLDAWKNNRLCPGSCIPPIAVPSAFLTSPSGALGGTYQIVELKYIAFDAGKHEKNDDTGQNNILKVTVRDGNGLRLTTLFSK